jgi:hypothetical protein
MEGNPKYIVNGAYFFSVKYARAFSNTVASSATLANLAGAQTKRLGCHLLNFKRTCHHSCYRNHPHGPEIQTFANSTPAFRPRLPGSPCGTVFLELLTLTLLCDPEQV